MHLELNLSGRELSDDMLKDLQQFLHHHRYEGDYEISIRTTDQAAARPASPARRQPHISARPRARQASSDTLSFNLPEEKTSPDGRIRFRPRH